jgi:hypothetical protein
MSSRPTWNRNAGRRFKRRFVTGVALARQAGPC